MKVKKRDRIKRIILEQFALLSLELIVVITLSVFSILAFYKISSLLLDNEIAAFDESVYQYIRGLASPIMDKSMLWATFLGNRQFIVVFCLCLMIYYLFLRPHRWYSIKIPAVAIGSISANIILKEIYDRSRPTAFQMIEASGLSFPSGHAMFNLSFYGLLIYIAHKEIQNRILRVASILFLSILILSIGLSRIYLGVHYASDVLAGFCAGFIWLIIALYITNKIENNVKEKKRKRSEAT